LDRILYIYYAFKAFEHSKNPDIPITSWGEYIMDKAINFRSIKDITYYEHRISIRDDEYYYYDYHTCEFTVAIEGSWMKIPEMHENGKRLKGFKYQYTLRVISITPED
jgi:hypothetical protein